MGEKKVSLIVPVYNVQSYIRECLDSLINQSLDECEIIIVNDGSTDDSREIIEGYEKKYDYIKFYNKINEGVSVARDFGLSKAEGKYILFIDPDDYIEETTVEQLYIKAEETESDMIIYGYKKFYDDKAIKGQECLMNVDDDKLYSNIEVLNMMLNLEVEGFLWNKFIRKESISKKEFVQEKGRYIQDWTPVFKQVYYSDKIAFINKPLYKYRMRGTSTVHGKNEKIVADYSHAVDNILGFIEVKKIEVNNKSLNNFKIRTSYRLATFYYYNFCANNIRKSDVYKYYNESKYKGLNISYLELLTNNSTPIKDKIKIILWKLKVFHLICPNK